jgi:hypothetical protein
MAQSSAVLHSFNGLTDALQCKEAIEVGHVRRCFRRRWRGADHLQFGGLREIVRARQPPPYQWVVRDRT